MRAVIASFYSLSLTVAVMATEPESAPRVLNRSAAAPRLSNTGDERRVRGSFDLVDFIDGDQNEARSREATSPEQPEKPKLNYGPPPDQPRKTLFQWSYGTSFDGGIDVDTEPLQTDRPDFTEPSTTVGKGVLQIETGYTYSRNEDPDDDTTSHSWGEPLFRYGVFADWLEFRMAFFPHNQTTAAGPGPHEKVSGLEDIYLGFKIALTPQEGWLPEMAIRPQMTVPTANKAVTHDRTLPGINWLYG